MNAKVYYAPEKHKPIKNYSIFLAGSIEQGTAKQWQEELISKLSHFDITIFNPRRKEWNPDVIQSIDDPIFSEQVNWELDHLTNCDLVVMFLDKNTQSPISLLELGILSQTGRDCIVCCEKGFWRKGNVEVVCDNFDITLVESFDELVVQILRTLEWIETVDNTH